MTFSIIKITNYPVVNIFPFQNKFFPFQKFFNKVIQTSKQIKVSCQISIKGFQNSISLNIFSALLYKVMQEFRAFLIHQCKKIFAQILIQLLHFNAVVCKENTLVSRQKGIVKDQPQTLSMFLCLNLIFAIILVIVPTTALIPIDFNIKLIQVHN